MLEKIKDWLRPERRSIENPAVPLTSQKVLEYLRASGAKTRSGETVGVSEAMGCSPVWQAVDLITSDISRMPPVVYERIEQFDAEGKRRAREHPAYDLLRRHTGEMTANMFIVRLVGHALLYGDGFARIHRRGMRPWWIEWLHHDRVTPVVGQLTNNAMGPAGTIAPRSRKYEVSYRGEQHGRDAIDAVDDADMIHLPGVTLDELGGMSLVEFARHAIGRQLATEHYTDDFFANLGQPSGFFRHPGELSPEAQENFLAQFERRHNPNGKRFRAGVLEEGMEWQAVGVSPEDALLVDQLRWGVRDVARFFNLPPHKLGEEAQGYNTTEQENRSYFNSSLGKWVSRLEWELSYKLLDEPQGDLFVEFIQEALFRADTKDRFEAYQIALQNAVMNPNEVRSRENLNPYEGGNEFMRPLNMGDVSDEDDEPDDDPGSDAGQRTSELLEVINRRDELLEQVDWCCRLIHNSATRAARQPRNYLSLLEQAIERHSEVIGQRAGPLAGELLEAARQIYTERAECQPDQLRERAAQGLDLLRGRCRTLCNQTVLEERIPS